MTKCRHDVTEDCPACMQETIDALVKALTDTLCELTACAAQLAARGLTGHQGDSVSRAQIAARQVLRHVGGAQGD